MAILTVFLALVVPAVLILLVALLLPTKGRLERDPSSAYARGRRGLIGLVGLVSLILGLILFTLGSTQNVEAVAGNVNAVHLGGIELVVLSVLLLAASNYYRRRIAIAKRGEDEEIVHVEAIEAAFLREAAQEGAGPYDSSFYDAPPPYRPPRREPPERYPPPYGRPEREPPERRPPAGSPPQGAPPRRRPPQDF